MPFVDIPPAPVQHTPIILAQAFPPKREALPDFVLKTCDEVLVSDSANKETNSISPSDWLISETYEKENKNLPMERYYVLSDSITLTQIQETGHGELIRYVSDGVVSYEYRPKPGYIGKDQAIFMTEYSGKRYKIVSDIIVSKTIDEKSPQCPEPKLIKVRK